MPPPALPDRLGYAFRRPGLLAQALTHRSFGADHYERLEFVGDAVLNCVVAAALFARFPDAPEGELSRMRWSLVDRDTLARLAAELGLDDAVRVGAGVRRSGGRGQASILADSLEAIFGAVLVDGGYEPARAVIERVYAAELAAANPVALGKDAKSLLQEWLQGRGFAVPDYLVTEASGEAHSPTFTVECRIAALGVVAAGRGRSRQAAEKAAAATAYAQVVNHAGDDRRA